MFRLPQYLVEARLEVEVYHHLPTAELVLVLIPELEMHIVEQLVHVRQLQDPLVRHHEHQLELIVQLVL